ncbi:MAG: cysteine desulfurase NifS [Firmicutes bacterium HGW-Firmicutes-1]|nr:MAG: cysteine desulfurase NifS [Firmicutes bacterium HGW-Firmicutes-1]
MKELNVYLDNAATTKAMTEVITKMCIVLDEHYGNPSSLHYMGIEAEKEVTEARSILARLLKVEKKEIFFTSGGTESNNLAILGVARAYIRSGKHIIISCYEHPSVGRTAKQLEEEGFEVTTIPVHSDGTVNLEVLEGAIRPDTILVSIMHVNNEIGVISPLDKIGQIIKAKNPNTIFHVDAVQSFGKIWLQPKKWQVDCLSISGHKIHASKGVGVLYISQKVKIKPLMYGGAHQMGIRSGTENTAGIAGLGVAADYMYSNLTTNSQKLLELKAQLRDGIMNNIERTFVNGIEGNDSAHHILNMRFEGVKGEVLLHALESKGIFISTGSACSSNKPEPSATLLSLGYTEAEVNNSVRFSFSMYNTVEEINYCIKQLMEIVPVLRKFVRK